MTFDSSSNPSSGSQPTSEERNWGVLAHLSGFIAAYIALGILGPTAVYFIKGGTSQFVRAHALEAINFNITVLIGIAAGALLSIIGIGILILVLIAVFYFVFTILAALAARRGELYRYPMTLRVIN